MNKLKPKLEHLQKMVERKLRTLLSNNDEFTRDLYNMIYYHMGWDGSRNFSGKMLRPVFGLLCCEAAGGKLENALPAVAAIELLHNFSLIHDDIEDNSEKRRSRKAVWALWGKPQAINAGDALFTIARNALLEIQDPQLALECIRSMDEACMSLCKGQFLDMSYEGQTAVSIDDYLHMVKLKTGSLWGLAGYLGVLAGTCNRTKASKFKQIGENIGITFQIRDDIFGIWGRQEITGKPDNDLQNRKKNLPTVHALSQGDSEFTRIYLKKEITPEDIMQMKAILEQTGSKSFCAGIAAHYSNEAKSLLEEMGENSLLWQLIDFLLNRQR